MSETTPAPGRPPLALKEQLSEINQALDALRERLRELSGEETGPAGPAPTRPDVIAPLEARGLDSVAEVLSIAPAGFAPAEVFGHAMDRVARLLEADRSMLFLLDPDRGQLVPAAGRGFRRDDLGGVAISPGEGLVGRSFVEGRAFSYARGPDVTPSDPFVVQFPVRNAVAVPVRAEGQMVGVLYAGRRGREAPFTADDTLVLVLIADRVATAFSHQRLVDRAARHLARLRELGTLAGQALVGGDLVETLARTCEVGCRLLEVRVAALGAPGEDGTLRLSASSGVPADVADRWRSGPPGLPTDMAGAERPRAWRDIEGRPEGEEAFLRELDIRACLVVPLRIHDKTVGVLYLGDPSPRDFAADEVEAAQVLASLAALAIENDRLYAEARGAFQALTVAQERMVQTEKARALGGMAGGVAHEFNNILAIILGKTQLMLARTADEPVREGLSQIEEAAWRAADVVRRLQGFAATRSDEAAVLVDINTLIQDAVTLTRGLWKDEAEARGVRIEVVTDPGETPVVLGSAAELREAVTNLVLNAIDAMPKGGRLALGTRRAGGGVEVTVSDSGEGMSEEVRQRIFDPFFSTRSPMRTGLGMSVVHGIVTRHRGRIDVFSQPGRGTTVTLWLPAGAAAPAVPPGRPEPERTAPREAASILVVEDEEQIREMLVDALTRAGHHVEAAADGLDGLARFQRGRFDVVVTDLSLPERSGLDVAQAVKRMRPATPVVLITGWGHLLDPARLREQGVDLTLIKPFRLDRVLAVLGDALRLRATP